MIYLFITLILLPPFVLLDLLLGIGATPLMLLVVSILSTIVQPDPSLILSPLLLVVAGFLEYVYRIRGPNIGIGVMFLETYSTQFFFLVFGALIALLLNTNSLPGLDAWSSSFIYLTIYFTTSLLLVRGGEDALAWIEGLLEHSVEGVEDALWYVSLVLAFVLSINVYMEIHVYALVYLALLGLAVYYRGGLIPGRLMLLASLLYALILTLFLR
ncbi:hypothetical protein [Desulfurococcus amylolyticus]|uniref:hypothetical protein n=1 Tax=Desulfurococcus amylolyticus TaxID=94694 RepID=UPI0005B1F806|nr:hypothetical protein [Desulfurococcus amylolyticus]